MLPSPTSCPCCGGKLAKLGETITETLESIPRSYKVIQTVREKFSCRACETITQPPAPFHPIARGRAGPNLLAGVMHGKFCDHQPLNRQSESFAREGIDLSVSTLADWVGACTTALTPLVTLIRGHVFAADRIHGDDTTVPVLAKAKTITGRLWTYVRDDRPFGGLPNRRRSSSTRATAAASIRVAISQAMRGSCRPTRMPGSTTSTIRPENPRRSSKPRVGRTGEENCSCLPMSRKRRWRSRRCAGSMRSSTSSATSTASPPSSGAPSDRFASRRSSAPSNSGCVPNAPSSRATTTSPGHGLHAQAMGAFTRFLDDGRICLTNNAAERALRGIAIGRKAWLFAGSDRGGERAAAMYSLIATAKLNDVDPRPGSPTCSPASPITRRHGCTNSCPGTGATPASLKPPPDRSATPRCPPEGYSLTKA